MSRGLAKRFRPGTALARSEIPALTVPEFRDTVATEVDRGARLAALPPARGSAARRPSASARPGRRKHLGRSGTR